MANQPLITVSSTIDSDIILQKASELATELDLPFCRTVIKSTTEFVLTYTPDGLQLLRLLGNSKRTATLLFVDFVHGKNGYRLAKNCTIKQPVARAVGIKSGFRPSLLDATAGLGTDAFVFASLGCAVTMIERSTLVAAILLDGLNRAYASPTTREIVHERMTLHRGDTIELLHTLPGTFHTIYLDPMYPHRTRSALNKQTMRSLRDIVGNDSDASVLLATSLEKAENRVVVKRPKGAPLLSETIPSYSISMKNSRFDIYLTFHG